MKKLIEKIGIETAFAGLFGLIAIAAVFFEMAIAGFDAASIAGGVKDIAGTIIAVVMLLIAIRALIPKKKAAGGFEDSFNIEMEKVISKYDPLIIADDSIRGRYKIADDISVLSKDIKCNYHKLFDFDYKSELSFTVSKTFFMGPTANDFTALQTNIINTITSKVFNNYGILNKKYKPIQDGFKLTFNQELLTPDDAARVVEVIDKIIFLYIVENRKS